MKRLTENKLILITRRTRLDELIAPGLTGLKKNFFDPPLLLYCR